KDNNYTNAANLQNLHCSSSVLAKATALARKEHEKARLARKAADLALWQGEHTSQLHGHAQGQRRLSAIENRDEAQADHLGGLFSDHLPSPKVAFTKHPHLGVQKNDESQEVHNIMHPSLASPRSLRRIGGGQPKDQTEGEGSLDIFRPRPRNNYEAPLFAAASSSLSRSKFLPKDTRRALLAAQVTVPRLADMLGDGSQTARASATPALGGTADSNRASSRSQ
ncbi:unnamed protein product, partial [Amoebophrya sp. A25]